MTGDARTLAVYQARHAEYAARPWPDTGRTDVKRFIARLPQGGAALDLGCGPGQAAAAMARADLNVSAYDLSPAMVARAAAHPGVIASCAGFSDLAAIAAFDGIWAAFSLLHAPRGDFPGHLGRIARALTPDGTFYLAMKTGTGEGRDALGRLYTYYSETELTDHLSAAGLRPEPARRASGTGLAGTTDPYVAIFARRVA